MENVRVRPSTLTMLCLLTFINSSIALFSAFSEYRSPEESIELMQSNLSDLQDDIEVQAESDEQVTYFNSIIQKVSDNLNTIELQNMALASGLANILTLIGAVMMWDLNKKGYVLYIVGTFVLILAPLFIYGGYLGMGLSGAAAFIGAFMCTLYGVHRKYMA